MNPLIGTCSWNYDSWVGLAYSEKCQTAVQYLKEYAKKYRTVEIDSWFYKIPGEKEVSDYLYQVDNDFRFTCKVTNVISLTHHRNIKNPKELKINDNFLANEIFAEYLTAVEPMLSQIDALMIEFEYLNREKMKSLEHFIMALDKFLQFVPQTIPLAIETRNKNYLKKEYFEFLKEKNLMHVFSEKIYMPHIVEVYKEYGELLTDKTVIRLLGGDRKEIEKKTAKKWNQIVEPRDDITDIADMTKEMIKRGMKVTINVNNHYEGSAPLTIEKLSALF